jgi:Putative lumazine-binding
MAAARFARPARPGSWHGADTFTDIFLLVDVNGRWRIANKAYHRRTRVTGESPG